MTPVVGGSPFQGAPVARTCGDEGGKRANGKPCGRKAGWGTDRSSGRCKDHPEPSPFDHIRHPKKRAYLAALSETGHKGRASELAGIDRTTPYTRQWLEDTEFQECVARAETMAADLMEEEARRRAIDGVDEPVGWYRGRAGGTVRRYSDTLLIFLLKGARPDKYRERFEHSGPGGAPLAVHVYLPENGRDAGNGDG